MTKVRAHEETLGAVSGILLRLVDITCVVVHINDVVRGLIRDAESAKLHVTCFTLFVNTGTLVGRAIAAERACGFKDRIDSLCHSFLAAVEVGKSLTVVHHADRHIESVGLGKVASPEEGVKLSVGHVSCGPGAVDLFAAEPLVFHAFAVAEQKCVVQRAVAVVFVIGKIFFLLVFIVGAIGKDLCHLRNTVVVDIAFNRPGEFFVRAGRVAEEYRAIHLGASAVHGIFGVNRAVLDCRAVSGFYVKIKAFHNGIGKDHVTRSTNHTVNAAGSRPTGDPSLIVIVAHETVKQFRHLFRCKERITCPSGTVGIPETVVDIDHAVFHLAGIGAAVLPDGGIVRSHVFGHGVGIFVKVVKCRIHIVELFFSGTLDIGNMREDVVPRISSVGGDLVKGLFGKLKHKVALCLIVVDIRGSKLQIHFIGIKDRNGRASLGGSSGGNLVEFTVNIHSARAVTLVIGVGNEAAVSTKGHHTVTDLVIKDHAVVLGILAVGKANCHTVRGGCHFQLRVSGIHTVLVKGNRIVMGMTDLVFVAELVAQVLDHKIVSGFVLGGVHHKLPGAALTDPDRGLMRNRHCEHIVRKPCVVLGAFRNGHRTVHVKALRHRDGRRGKTVRESRRIVRASENSCVVAGACFHSCLFIHDRNIVKIGAEFSLGFGNFIFQNDLVDHLARIRRNRSVKLIPLLGKERAALALRQSSQRIAVLINKVSACAVGKIQAERKIHLAEAVVVMLAHERRENVVGKYRILAHGDIQRIKQHSLGFAHRGMTLNAQRVCARNTGVGRADPGFFGAVLHRDGDRCFQRLGKVTVKGS